MLEIRAAAAAIGVCVLAPLVAAQQTAENATDDGSLRLDFTPEWVVRFEPAVGYFAASGDISLPSSDGVSSDMFELEGDLNLDSPRLGPYIEVTAARDRWRLIVSGLGFSIERGREARFTGRFGDIAVTAGDRIDSELSYATFGARVGYRFWDWVSGADGAGTPELSLGVDALVGFRAHDIDFDTRLAPLAPTPGAVTSSGVDESFAEPVAGLALELDYQRTYGLDFYVTGGGFSTGDRSSYSFDLGIGFSYRPRPWIGAIVGYRLLVLGLEDGDGPSAFEWDGAVAGLYWGVQLSF